MAFAHKGRKGVSEGRVNNQSWRVVGVVKAVISSVSHGAYPAARTFLKAHGHMAIIDAALQLAQLREAQPRCSCPEA